MYIFNSAFVVLIIILKQNWSHAQDVPAFDPLYLMRLQNCEDCYSFDFIGICKKLFKKCKEACLEKGVAHEKAFEESAKKLLGFLNDTSKLEPEYNSSAYCLGFLEDGIAGKQFCNMDLGSEMDITYRFLAKKLGDSLRKEFNASSVETVRISMQPENDSDDEAFMESLFSELPNNEESDFVDDSGEEPTDEETDNESPEPIREVVPEAKASSKDSLSWSSLERGSAQNFITYKVWMIHKPKGSRKRARNDAIKKATEQALRKYGKNRVLRDSTKVGHKKGYFIVKIKVKGRKERGECQFC